MAYIGNDLDNDIQVNKYFYIAGTPSDIYDGSLTRFPCTYDRQVDITLNGWRLPFSQVTATTGTYIDFITPVTAGTEVIIDGFYNIQNVDATAILYDNGTSGLSATTTQTAIDELSAEKANDLEVIHNDNTDETKLGSLTIGESISVTNWEYVTTTITLTVASHNAKASDTIYVSGLVADVGDAPNGTYTVDSVTATTIVYTVGVAPTATADTGTTVLSALVKYGEVKSLGGVDISSIGINQIWASFSRSASVVYTNTTGRPIMVSVICSGVSGTNIIKVNGVSVAQHADGDTESNTVTVLVPTGATYQWVGTAGIGSWLELR